MVQTILVVLIIVLIVRNTSKSKNKSLETSSIPQLPDVTIKENEIEKNYNLNYYKKDYLLTSSELSFYKALKQVTDELELSVFTQVSLYAVIKNKDYKDFNKIKSKSIDFVVTEKNCKIKMCIELDDYSHNKQSRIERDIFLDKLFNDVNLKLVRIKVDKYYNLDTLRKLLKEPWITGTNSN